MYVCMATRKRSWRLTFSVLGSSLLPGRRGRVRQHEVVVVVGLRVVEEQRVLGNGVAARAQLEVRVVAAGGGGGGGRRRLGRHLGFVAASQVRFHRTHRHWSQGGLINRGASIAITDFFL